MAAPSVHWWKFSTPNTGVHLLRAKNVGLQDQEVLLDGAPLEAPAGTTSFTGPEGCFMQLKPLGDDSWTLVVDEVEVEPYSPTSPSQSKSTVAWWKFALTGTGTHHVRVKNLGQATQELYLDGAFVEAPQGCLTFTGPCGSLLEFQQRGDSWVLLVDGFQLQQCNPHADQGEPPLCWDVELPNLGTHHIRAIGLGRRGQEVFLDGVLIPAPEGELAFTGPGGSLIELKQRAAGVWQVFVDGQPGAEGIVGFTGLNPGQIPSEAVWNFAVPNTGAVHSLKVHRIGHHDQQVWIDSTEIPAPPGQRAFTGPGGCLLEIRALSGQLELFVDGRLAEVTLQHRTIPTEQTTAPASSPARAGEVALPQGVSLDSSTGKYKANVRVQGRFRCLGEFATPEEAHQRYLAAKQELGI